MRGHVETLDLGKYFERRLEATVIRFSTKTAPASSGVQEETFAGVLGGTTVSEAEDLYDVVAV